MKHLSELTGKVAVYEILSILCEKPGMHRGEVAKTVQLLRSEVDYGYVDDTLQTLLDRGLLSLSHDNLYVTKIGRRICLLLEGINGKRPISQLLRRLKEATETAPDIELVREGMTSRFIRALVNRPDFHRLYICSPWISFETSIFAELSHAVQLASSNSGALVELLVITRPLEKQNQRESYENGLIALRSLGANIRLHKNLHTKLYIREPGASGGLMAATIGSQNLTKSNYLELGIHITNDSALIQQLIAYFFELYNTSGLTIS